MAITQPEYENFVGRLEYYYRYDSPHDRPERSTKVDAAGYVEWCAAYHELRTEAGLDHETATQECLNAIWAIEHPQPPPPTKPIKGQLRVKDNNCFVDDNGLVLPALCHFGESFSAFTRRPDDVKRQLDVIAAADYHGVRFWDCLGYYAGGWAGKEVAPISFKNDKGQTIPATPGYYDKLQKFLEALKERSLVAHHSRGDLNSWGKQSILNHCVTVGQVQRAVGLPTIALNEACNEAQQNIQDWSTGFLDQMIAAINNPSVLKALSDVCQNEDTDTLVKYARDCVYIHGFRGQGDGDPVGVVRHIHSLRYDGAVKVAGKTGWQGEPAGRGTSVAQVTRPDTLVLMALQAWCCRQAWVYTSKNGIFFNGPIEDEPGFREVPKARYWLPADVMTYTDAFHGGTSWIGKRVLKADDPQGLCRADHRLRGKDLTITVHSKPGRVWNLPVERAFVGHVVDPIHGPGDERQWNVGQTFDFDGRDRTGVVIVGKLL